MKLATMVIVRRYGPCREDKRIIAVEDKMSNNQLLQEGGQWANEMLRDIHILAVPPFQQQITLFFLKSNKQCIKLTALITALLTPLGLTGGGYGPFFWMDEEIEFQCIDMYSVLRDVAMSFFFFLFT